MQTYYNTKEAKNYQDKGTLQDNTTRYKDSNRQDNTTKSTTVKDDTTTVRNKKIGWNILSAVTLIPLVVNRVEYHLSL